MNDELMNNRDNENEENTAPAADSFHESESEVSSGTSAETPTEENVFFRAANSPALR